MSGALTEITPDCAALLRGSRLRRCENEPAYRQRLIAESSINEMVLVQT